MSSVFRLHLPLIEGILFCVTLETSFFDEELHALVGGIRDGRRLFAQQDVDGLGGRDAERRFIAVACGATFRVLAIQQAILVVVFAVVAFQLQGDTVIRTFPAFLAAATPAAASFRRLALASLGAVARAALQSAVLSVPARDAEAGAVLALAVLVAPGIAEPLLAELACPSGVADASAGLAPPVTAKVFAASRFGAIVSRPQSKIMLD
jgi:hypothetical protein